LLPRRAFMTDVLGVERLNMKEGLEGFRYHDGKDSVTVLSLPDASNIVHLGKELPVYSLDSTSNVLPSASPKAIKPVLDITVPACEYGDETRQLLDRLIEDAPFRHRLGDGPCHPGQRLAGRGQ
jgi:hypothetical protein